MKRALSLTVLALTLAAADARAQSWGVQAPMTGCGCPAGGCGAAPAAVIANESPCCPAGQAPGLFPHLRERLRGNHSSCGSPCPARPGLLQRIRERVAERRACTNACVTPCP
jgi:hypothetical protein